MNHYLAHTALLVPTRFLLLLLFVLLSCGETAISQPVISGFNPLRNTTATAINSDIVLTWSQQMSTATLTSGTIRAHGSMTGLYTTSAVFSYSNGNTQVTITPATSFRYGEKISVSVTNAQSSSGVAMTRATVWGFTAAVAGGSGAMERGWSNPNSANTANAIGLGDLDGDGDLDMYIGNSTIGNADQVWKNDGVGNFTQGWTGNGGYYSTDIELGDLDGDGDLDVYEGSNIIVAERNRAWENDGSGNFTLMWIAPIANNTSNVELGDIDGDGDLDAVEAGRSPDYYIRTRTNDGSGNFTDGWVVSTTSSLIVWGLVLGDFDSDGDIDIFQSAATNTLWKNDGVGNFTSAWTQTGLGPTFAVEAGDVDNDGDLDIVESRFGSQYRRVLKNDGNGYFTETWRQATLAVSGNSLALGDLDGDGDLDMYESNVSLGSTFSPNRIWKNDGTGNFTATMQKFGSIGGSSPQQRFAALGDVDGDGSLDIVEAGNSRSGTNGVFSFSGVPCRVWLNNHAPRVTSITPSFHALNRTLATSSTMIFNTCMDVATLTTSTIKMYGSFTGRRSIAYSTISDEITALTLNPVRDLLPGERMSITVSDLVKNSENKFATHATVMSFTGAVKASNGAMWPTWTENGSSATSIVVAGDMDFDGDVDMVEGGNGRSSKVWLNNGSSGFANSWTTGSSSATTSIILADFDGDGDLDMFQGNFGQPNVLWKNDGGGNFSSSWVQPGSATATRGLAVGDLDGDTDLDIYEGNDGQGNKIWMNDGAGVFANTWTDAVNMSATKSVAIGDIDNDGDLDLFEGNRNDLNRAWKNDGEGNFTNTWWQGGMAPATVSVVLEDFDGDGDLDVFEGNEEQLNSLWQNDGSGNFTQFWTANGNGNTTISIVAADVDGDGDMDIVECSGNQPNLLWTNNGSGSFTSSLMQGNAAYGTVSIAIADFDGDQDLDFFCGNNGQANTLWKKEVPRFVITAMTPSPISSGRQVTVSAQLRHDGDIPMLVPADVLVTLTTGHLSAIPSALVTQATIQAGQSDITFALTLINTTTTAVALPVTITTAGIVALSTNAVVQLSANNRPQIIFNQPIYRFLEDESTTLTVQISDMETPVTSLTLSIISSRTDILPDSNIVLLETTRSITSQTMKFRLTSLPNKPENYADNYALSVTVRDGLYTQVQRVTINTLAVNDPPSFTTGANIIVYDTDPAKQFNNWATNVSAGPGENQSVAFVLNNSNTSLFSSQPVVRFLNASTGWQLSLTPKPGKTGTAVINVYAKDDGYMGNGGLNTSATQTFTITVLPSPPTSLRAKVLAGTVHSGDTVLIVVDAVTRFGHARPVNQATIVMLGTLNPYLAGRFIETQATIPAGETTATFHVLVFNSTTSTLTASFSMTATVEGNAASTRAGLTVLSAVPTGLTTTIVDYKPQLAWNEPNAIDVAGYAIYRRLGTGAFTEVGRTTATVYIDTSAVQTQTYGYAVRSLLDIWQSPLSGISTIQVPGCTLVAPNGAENWRFGETRMISWNSVGTIAMVTLEYSANNGSSWSTIATVPNSGGYNWVLPPVFSTQALVRISSGMVMNDVSDAAFTLWPVTALTISVVQSTVATSYCIGSPLPGGFDVYLADPTFPVTRLTVTAVSSDQEIVANSDIAVQGVTGAVTSMLAMPSATETGATLLTITASNGSETMSTTLTFKTIVSLLPAPVIRGTTATCFKMKTAYYIMPGMANEKYQWSVTGGYIEDGQGSPLIWVWWTTTGTTSVEVVVTNANQCSSSASVEVSVRPMAETRIVANYRACTNTSVILTAESSGMIYNWSNGATTQSISISQPGLYWVSISDGTGCKHIETIFIDEPASPVVNAGSDIIICTAATIVLDGSATSNIGGLTYSWAPSIGMNDPTLPNPTVLVSTTTTYTLFVSDSLGCTSSDDVTVAVVEPDVRAATSQSICAGGSVWLWASGGSEYSWSPADGLSSTTESSITAYPSTTTTYTVAVTVGLGCVIEKQVTIAVIPYQDTEFSNGRTLALCLGSSGQFGTIPVAEGYVWWPHDGLSDPYIANPIVTAFTTSATSYTVWGYSTTACINPTTVYVVVPQMQLDINVLLEGAMVSDSMAYGLHQQNLLPAEQPFGATPFYYNGSETLAPYEHKPGIVDWVFVELRDALAPTTVVNRRAALLRSDGRIVDPYGPESLGFYSQASADSFYIVVWHRNHLGVMSALPVSVTSSTCTAVYDFTSSAGAAYRDSDDGEIVLPNGRYGMIAGDSYRDGIVNAFDRVAVRNRTGQTGYLVEDISLDGIVNALDRVLVRRHTARTSQVPSN